jgi:hypothetical protein
LDDHSAVAAEASETLDRFGAWWRVDRRHEWLVVTALVEPEPEDVLPDPAEAVVAAGLDEFAVADVEPELPVLAADEAFCVTVAAEFVRVAASA